MKCLILFTLLMNVTPSSIFIQQDYLLFYGSIEAIFRIMFALIDLISPQILACNDFETLVILLTEIGNHSDQKYSKFSISNNNFMEKVFYQAQQYDDDFSRHLEQYRLEFRILQEEFAHLSSLTSVGSLSSGYQNQNQENTSKHYLMTHRFFSLNDKKISSSNNFNKDSNNISQKEIEEKRITNLEKVIRIINEEKFALQLEIIKLRSVISEQQTMINTLKQNNQRSKDQSYEE